MIPFASCVCPALKSFRRRDCWLVAPQQGAELEVVEKDDGCFCFHPKGCVENEKRPFVYRCNAYYISRRPRRPVITPVGGLDLVDETYSGIAQVLLNKCNRWSFNTFNLDVCTGGRSLPFLLFHLFQEYGFVNYFRLDVVKVLRCFNTMEAAYHRHNPYHNSVHAADVTQAMHCFLQENKFSRHLTPVESMASIIAAVAHDLDHPGVTQTFLVATSNHLVDLYHNSSVLENHHWRTAVSCLLESGIFSHFEKNIWCDIQTQIRSLILATDVTRQKEFLCKFTNYLSSQALDMEKAQCRHFALQIALKCADLCNPCRPWAISQRWSYQVCQEFYRQGTFERHLNLPLTPTFDCSRTRVPKIQTEFFQHVVIPLFETWNKFLDTRLSNHLLENLRHNFNEWKRRMDLAEQQNIVSSSSKESVPLHTTGLNEKTIEKTSHQKSSSKLLLKAYSTEELNLLTTLLSLSNTTSTVQLTQASTVNRNENLLTSPSMTQQLHLIPSEYLLPLDCDRTSCILESSPGTNNIISPENKDIPDCKAQGSSPTEPRCCVSSASPKDIKLLETNEFDHCHSSSLLSSLKGLVQQKCQSPESEKVLDHGHIQGTNSLLPSHKSDEKGTKHSHLGCSDFYQMCFHTSAKVNAGKTSLCSMKNAQRFIAPVKITASWCWNIKRSLSAERPQQTPHDVDCLLPHQKCSNSCQTCNKTSGRRGSAPAPVAWNRDNNSSQTSSLGSPMADERLFDSAREICGSGARRWSIPLEPISG